MINSSKGLNFFLGFYIISLENINRKEVLNMSDIKLNLKNSGITQKSIL